MATRANVDGHAVGLLRGMSRSYGGGPVWVRVVRDRALLLLSPSHVHRALEGSPDPFAADPKSKRDIMCTFQPDALTISRGELWRNRRDFAEAVLDTARPRHRLADRFAVVAREETEALLAEAGDELTYEPWNLALRRITRRVVFGDAARDDEALFELLGGLMSEANGMPGTPGERYPELLERIGAYVAAAEEGSLVSLFGEAPFNAETHVDGQVIHWLFATGDTLASNSFRGLALLASHPVQRAEADAEAEREDAGLPYLEACLQEGMRLWPTTNMLARETLVDTDWRGAEVPAGTNVMIANHFFHRDTDRHPWADRFSPEQWTGGDAAESWSFNHFSRGPQGCPGAGLALFLAKAAVGTVLTERAIELRSPKLDPAEPMPHMLDFFRTRIGLTPR